MSNIWLDISAKLDDAVFIRIAEAVNQTCKELGIEYYLVGAAARDMIFR